MFQLKEMPRSDFVVVEVDYSSLSMLERIFRFNERKKEKVKSLELVPQPVVIYDPRNGLQFDRTYKQVSAYLNTVNPVHNNPVTVYYLLKDLTPYAVMNGNKLCSVKIFEIQIDSFR